MFYTVTKKLSLEMYLFTIFVSPNVNLFSPQAGGIFVWRCLRIFSKYYVNFVFKDDNVNNGNSYF